jgi:pilus assembly protein Flp/PilA
LAGLVREVGGFRTRDRLRASVPAARIAAVSKYIFGAWIYPFGTSSPIGFGRVRAKPRRAVMHRTLVRFWRDRSGATAIEYGLIGAGISITIVAVVGTIGTQLNTTFSSVSTQLK